MRVSKQAFYQCDECGAEDRVREIKVGRAPYMLCDRCAEKLASMLLQRVRESRLTRTRKAHA